VINRALNPLSRGLLPILCVPILAVASGAQARQQVRPLAIKRFALPNGMTVILNEDHATPLVAVNVAYHVGAKDDPPGERGITHLCEHAVALGSPNVDQPLQPFYRSIGGTSTRWAETTDDLTTFYVAVPTNQLETALWAESDRMAAPLSRLTAERLNAIRSVVRQERQQNVENATFGVSRELTLAALFPAGHPYHIESAVAGADLTSLTVEELRAACAPFYTAANAVLSLSGDFDTQRVQAWVNDYFATIPPGAPLARRQPAAVAQQAERRLVLEDRRASQSQLHIDWVGAAYTSADHTALMALAYLLSANRFGRLSKVLVDERQLATGVSVVHYDSEQSGVFEILVLPRPGASLSTIESLVDSVIAGLATSPPTAEELARFNAANAVTAATSLQIKIARADTLAHDQIFAGDPVFYAVQANDGSRLTPADVQRVAANYLTSSRVVMSLVPAGQLNSISKPDLPFVNVTPSRGESRP
jgi:zinc protease